MTAAAIFKPAPPDPTATSERVSHVDPRAVLHFPPFRLDLVEERLWKGEREVPLGGKQFAILRYLAHRPRRLVTRSEIVEAVWGRRVAMSGSLLRSHIHNLRRALGEAVIETVIGRGYRFMVTVTGEDDGRPGRRHGEVADSIAGRASDLMRGRRFELAREAAPGSVHPIVTQSDPSDAHAQLLDQLFDALAALGLSARVVLVIGDETRSRPIPAA
jgi:DNA-binding winged helix-turn-helix (wHTH) protein